MARTLLLVIALLALCAVPASAAKVELVEIYVEDDDESYDREDDSYSYSVLRFKAAPGERNRLSIKRVRGGILFRDAGARVRAASRGCRKAGRRAAVCRRGTALRSIDVRLGNRGDRLAVSTRVLATVDAEGGPGDDRLNAGGGRALLGGGPGADRLTGGRRGDDLGGDGGRDRLLGGRGGDFLHGGPGRDRLAGGGGNDRLLPADGESDRLDGGAGRDVVNYSGWKPGVVADPKGGGTAPERDSYEAIENLAGGRGDDLLTGDDGANRIWGGGGDDRIDARGGDDVVDVRGASTTKGSVDATCGEGKDTVSSYAGNDRVLMRPDCESLDFPSAGLRFGLQTSPPAGRTVRLSLPCAGAGDPEASRVVTVRTAPEGRRWSEAGPFDAEIAHGTLPAGTSRDCDTAVELTDAGAELLAARGELPVVVRVGARFFTPFAVVLPAS